MRPFTTNKLKSVTTTMPRTTYPGSVMSTWLNETWQGNWNRVVHSVLLDGWSAPYTIFGLGLIKTSPFHGSSLSENPCRGQGWHAKMRRKRKYRLNNCDVWSAKKLMRVAQPFVTLLVLLAHPQPFQLNSARKDSKIWAIFAHKMSPPHIGRSAILRIWLKPFLGHAEWIKENY